MPTEGTTSVYTALSNSLAVITHTAPSESRATVIVGTTGLIFLCCITLPFTRRASTPRAYRWDKMIQPRRPKCTAEFSIRRGIYLSLRREEPKLSHILPCRVGRFSTKNFFHIGLDVLLHNFERVPLRAAARRHRGGCPAPAPPRPRFAPSGAWCLSTFAYPAACVEKRKPQPTHTPQFL